MENSELLVLIGNRIRELRKKREMSQEQLSEIADLHPSSLSHIERGKVDSVLGNYARLANALEIPLAELVDVTTNFDDVESSREARDLLERLKGLDQKRRAVYLDAALKLFERIESF